MYQMNIEVLALVKKLEIAVKILVQNRVMSRYRSVFRGRGLEFEGYREYTQSDDAEMIDWKATVRSKQTVVRQFQEERNLDIHFLFDVSSSMLFGSTDKLKSEYAAEFIASLAHFMLGAGDNVGLYMYSDEVRHFLPCTGGNEQFYAIMKSLVNTELYGGPCDLQNAINFIIRSARKESLLVIVSDFIGLKEGWKDSIKLATGKFDVIGVMIRDPRDRELPKNIGQIVISDPFSKRTMLIDPEEIGDEYERFAQMNEEQIKRGFIDNNGDFIEFTTEVSFIRPLVNFFKRRQILLSL
jgi:uncharacterized protein (DUF58 family)